MIDRNVDSRARQRRHWPVTVRRLSDESSDDLSGVLTAEERIALVWTLSERMWELTGRPLPTYTRAEIPVTVKRLR